MELLTVELHTSVLETGRTKFLGEGIENDQFCGILTLIGILFRSSRSGFTSAILHAIVLENLLHFLVGIATVALDDGMRQMPLLDIGLTIEFEDDTITEFLFIGTQGADEIAETLREHRDGTVDEIDARRTVVGLLIDGGAFLHIMTHICNMNTYLI